MTKQPEKVFDLDAIDAILKVLSPAAFGVLVARAIRENPESKYWALVSTALKGTTGWDLDWEQVRDLVERLAEAK